MRERLERLALYAAVLLLLAFTVSFVFGLLRPRTAHGPLAGSAPSRTGMAALPAVARGRLEVLNGSGRLGLARRATEQLRDAGFDVVYFGNASPGRDSSEVLDRVGSPAVARAAADQLGIVLVRAAPDSTLLLDATVVLGRDWLPAVPAAEEPRRRGWWARMKGWLGAD
jgi:hypothetical protein